MIGNNAETRPGLLRPQEPLCRGLSVAIIIISSHLQIVYRDHPICSMSPEERSRHHCWYESPMAGPSLFGDILRKCHQVFRNLNLNYAALTRDLYSTFFEGRCK